MARWTRTLVLGCGTLLLATGPRAEDRAPPPGLAPLLARADAAYDLRDEAGRLDEAHATLDEASRLAPDDYGVLWRSARLAAWLAEDPALPDARRSALGEVAWRLAERATRADPTRVEGWFYAAAGIGSYALGIGILTALTRGIEGRFRDRLARAERIAPGFLGGAIQVAWGASGSSCPGRSTTRGAASARCGARS
jgi:hypothetical protein